MFLRQLRRSLHLIKIMTKEINKKRKEKEIRKSNKPHHPDIIFNGNPVEKGLTKNMGMLLDSKLHFDDHIKGVFDNTSKSVGLMRKLRNFLLRLSLLQIYKSFVRPYLDDGDIINEKASMGSF